MCRFQKSNTGEEAGVEEEKLFIQGLGKEIWRSDHPRDTKQGSVCLYFKEDLPIKRRTDLEIMDETTVAEISIKRKKIIFVVTYHSLSQKAEDFHLFLDKLQLTLDYINDIKFYSIVLTGDFNCRSSHWWAEDTELPEGTDLDQLIKSNNLFQLSDQPTHIRGNSRSCTDLIIIDQPNLFVDNGVHPSLDKHCHHNIIFGKMNLSVPHAPPYKRKVWDYSKADKDAIRSPILSINWAAAFSSLDVDEITESLIDILSTHIPNKIITCNEKDPPWMTSQLKTATERKHRVYNKY